MTTLRETLAEHPPQETSYDAGWIEGCWCGWERPPRISNEEGWAAYFDHLETVVLAWVEARLEGADVRRSMAEAMAEWAMHQAAPTYIGEADAALTAIRDALGVPGAPAGGEVAPEAAGGEIGPRIDAQGADCPLPLPHGPHLIQTFIAGGEPGPVPLLSARWCPGSDVTTCEACPFLGCDGCEAEVARRANGEAK